MYKQEKQKQRKAKLINLKTADSKKTNVIAQNK